MHVEARILKLAMSAALEVDVSGAFVNAKQGITKRMCLLKMNQPQEATSIEIYYTTSHGMLTKAFISTRFKAIDVRFFWLRGKHN